MKIQAFSKLTDQNWLNLFNISYVDNAGRVKNWQIASRQSQPKCVSKRFDPPDAVVIVPYHCTDDKVVITREYRVPLGDYEYGFPAGLVDRGETIEAATQRELLEETGLQLTRIRRIGPPVYSSAGMTDESVAMVYVECRGKPSTSANQGSEAIEVLLVSASEADELCRDAALKFDAKAWLVLSGFADHGNLL